MLKLNRALYGLAQSGREWQATHHAELLKLKWQQCPVESCLFGRWLPAWKCYAYMVTWVDNLFMGFPPKCTERGACIKEIQAVFELNDLGPVSYTLGARIEQVLTTHTISLDQEHYIDTLHERYKQELLTHSVKVDKRTVPAGVDIYELHTNEPESPACLQWIDKCQSLNGALRFLADFSRVDICASLSWAARHVHRASKEVYVALLGILAHVVHTKHWRLWYGPGRDRLIREMFVNGSDLALDPWKKLAVFMASDASHGVRPLLCAMLFVGGTLVDWRICRAASPALSACENEWYAMCMAATMMMAMAPIFDFIDGLDVVYPIMLFVDSSSAIQLSQMDLTTRNMKHAAIRLDYLQHIVGDLKRLLPVKVDGTSNLADLGTKVLAPNIFHRMRMPIIHG